jgi:Ser/Thr protein kinase RdoA (MazF antagonist)
MSAASAVSKVHERAGSIITEMVLDDGVEVVVKKQRESPNDPRPASESARIEYEVLTALRRDMTATVDGILYTVPRALQLDESAASVMMTRAAGTPLDRIISAARRRRAMKALETPLRQAGRWLRIMQQSTRSEGDSGPILATLVDAALHDLNAVPDLSGVRERVGALLKRMSGPFSVAGHHGDLWPGNLFMSGRSVEVIDFEGFRDGLPLEDAAYFLSYLELLPLAMFDYPRMERAFLDGFLDGDPLDRRALELFKVMHAVRTLARMMTRRSLRDRVVRRTLMKTILRSLR